MFSFPEIDNKIILYLIVFLLILSISYVDDTLQPDYYFLRNIVSKIIILFLIILNAENNVQISLILAIIFIILSMTEVNESFVNKKPTSYNKIENKTSNKTSNKIKII